MAVRVAVTGAAGAIGYSLVYRIAAGDLLGDVPVELRLLDVAGALPALNGVAMELADCAFEQLAGVEITADPRRAFDGVNIAMLVGASARKAGMQRSDLLAVSSRIFASQGAALSGAAGDLKVVVASNLANTNARTAYQHAAGVPSERFSALTRLDHNRARSLLARKSQLPVRAVTNVTIWGNHSATQYPDAFNAKLAGRPAAKWLADDAWIAFDFVPKVANRGAEIIAARGSASAASGANATIEHVRDWVQGTPEGDWVSMAVPSDGSYGVPEGLVSSFPCRCVGGQYRIVQGLPLNAFARSKLDASIVELAEEAAQADALG